MSTRAVDGPSSGPPPSRALGAGQSARTRAKETADAQRLPDRRRTAQVGSTFLYAETSRRRDTFAMLIGNKEADCFRRGRVYVDASPLYIDDLVCSAGNIRAALAGHEVRIVGCLRHPLERASSHYLHGVAQDHGCLGYTDQDFWVPRCWRAIASRWHRRRLHRALIAYNMTICLDFPRPLRSICFAPLPAPQGIPIQFYSFSGTSTLM